MTTVGFLHPGSMGVTLAAAVRGERLWVGAGRSSATASRAASAQLVDAGTLADLCRRSDVIVSICPPDAAVEVADSVSATGYDGRYVDANAIAPATSMEIAARFGDRYLDGGVIGPPALRPGTTRLYLAGRGASEVANLWHGSALDVRVLGESADHAPASSLKMAYAGWTKGSSALLLTINALAERAGVADALRTEWRLSQPGLAERSTGTAAGVGPKAWRWVGEMEEIAATMAAAGLPTDFHDGAAEVYRRLTGFKGSAGPDLDEVLDAMLDGPRTNRGERATPGPSTSG